MLLLILLLLPYFVYPFEVGITVDDFYFALRDSSRKIVYWSLDWRDPPSRRILCSDIIASPIMKYESEFPSLVPDQFMSEGLVQEMTNGNQNFQNTYISTYSYIQSKHLRLAMETAQVPYNPRYIQIIKGNYSGASMIAREVLLQKASENPQKIWDQETALLVASRSFENSWKFHYSPSTEQQIDALVRRHPEILVYTTILTNRDCEFFFCLSGQSILLDYLRLRRSPEAIAVINLVYHSTNIRYIERYREFVRDAISTHDDVSKSFWIGMSCIVILSICHRELKTMGETPSPNCFECLHDWFTNYSPDTMAPFLLLRLVDLLRNLPRNPFRKKSQNLVDPVKLHALSTHFGNFPFPWLNFGAQLHVWRISLVNNGYFDDSLGSRELSFNSLIRRFAGFQGLRGNLNYHPKLRQSVTVTFDNGHSKTCEDLYCLLSKMSHGMKEDLDILRSLESWRRIETDQDRMVCRAFARVVLMNLLFFGSLGLKFHRETIDCFTTKICKGNKESFTSVATALIKDTDVWRWVSPKATRLMAYSNSIRLTRQEMVLCNLIGLGLTVLIVVLVTLLYLSKVIDSPPLWEN